MSSTKDDSAADRRVKIAYLVSHPIQYQAPLLRRVAQEPDIDLTVLFGSSFSVRGYSDKGFGGVDVKWDVPLLDGYKHEFLPVIRDNATVGPFAPINYGIFRRLRGRSGSPPFDLLWVHGYSTLNALHGILLARALGIPVLLRAESTLVDRERGPLRLLCKKLFFTILRSFVDGVLPIGTLNAAYWRHYFGDDFPAWVTPYAVDNAYFRKRSLDAVAHRSALQAELNLDPSRPVLLFASKLQKRKRCMDLIESYLQYRDSRHSKSRPYLVIVGDGEERKALEARAALAAHGVDIRFCGFRNQSELPRFFDLATVFVLPSRHEPWGLVVNEVMNAGRAIILTTDVGCQPDLITNGVEGCVVPPGDIGALVTAMARILETSGMAERMGQDALRRIQHWDFQADIRGLRAAVSVLTRRIDADTPTNPTDGTPGDSLSSPDINPCPEE